jgi:hypothetical protein
MKRLIDYIDHPIVPCVGAIIAIYSAFLSNDQYALKIIGLILYNIIIFRNEIKKWLSGRNKKKDRQEK